MFYYNDNGKLTTSAKPIQGLTLVTLKPEQLKYCIGFDAKGIPVYDYTQRDKEALADKQKLINTINSTFESNCKNVGVDFEGNKFQYDKDSQFMLLQAKDDIRVTFWRSVDNKNIPLTNTKKNSLYKLIVETYFTEFALSREKIDLIGLPK